MKDLDALLLDTLLALGGAQIIERKLVPETQREKRAGVEVHGGVQGQRVYINPDTHRLREEVLSTLLHEGVHLARPQWQERSVAAAEKRLIRMLSEPQAVALWKHYRKSRRRMKGASEF